jgi:acyl carrier protein
MIMTKQEISEKVDTFLIERLEMSLEYINPDAELKRDLGLTSIDAVELSLFIKRQFNFLLQEKEVKSLITLDDLYNYIVQNQKV